MKRLLLILCFLTITSQAQIVNIPDANFKATLLEAATDNSIAFNESGNNIKIDANDDGEIQESEAIEVTGLLIGNENISDLTGIMAFSNLTFLDLQNNQLATFDASVLSNNLTYLDCTNNNLTDLNLNGLTNLEYLYCEFNLLTSLDLSGLNGIIDIYCAGNQLTTINIDSGSTFGFLIFNDNQISDLSFLEGSNFNVVEAAYNQITDLDWSSANVNYGLFIGNPLQTVNIKNGIYDYDNFTVEFIILPDSPQFICADEFELDDIINDVDNWEYSTLVSTYCSFEPGGEYNAFTGALRLDTNANGCDEMDLLLSNILISINDENEQGFASTNLFGEYLSYAQLGDFTVAPVLEYPNWFNVSPLNTMFSLEDYGNLETQDFCISPNGVHNDIEVIISPIIPAQPGFDALYELVYNNKGNQIANGDIELIYDDTVLDFESSSNTITSQTSGSILWDYADLNPFESRSIIVTLNVNSPMESPAINIGDQLDFYVTINPVSSDETPSDNEFAYKETVVGSFDPNDITCLQGDIVSPDMIGEYLHYNIRFENTGTAAATFVVVANEIDETQYDLSTLQILNASHEMTTRMVGNKIEFIFDDINLQPDGRGNVLYKIKSLNTLVLGDDVSQQANIYFDYNFPIETNTATTTFDVLSVDEFELDNSVSVYPNPTNGQLFINSTYGIENIVLYDIQGRKVQGFNPSEGNMLDISNVSKGVYFLEITSVKGNSTTKIIKD